MWMHGVTLKQEEFLDLESLTGSTRRDRKDWDKMKPPAFGDSSPENQTPGKTVDMQLREKV